MHIFQSPDERGIVVQILESGYRFVLGSIGGGLSLLFIYFIQFYFILINK